MMRLISLVFVLASTAMALPGGLHAQILGQEGAAHQPRVHAPTGVSRTFGTVDEAVVTLTASDFTPLLSSHVSGYSVGATGLYRFCQDTGCEFRAGVHLPAGAILTRVQLDACDTFRHEPSRGASGTRHIAQRRVEFHSEPIGRWHRHSRHARLRPR